MTIPSTVLPFVFVDYTVEPAQALAKDLIKSDNLATHQVTIWCESRAEIHAIRQRLIQYARSKPTRGFKLPAICTLQDWVWQQATPDHTIVNDTNKQLVLVNAIRQKSGIFKSNNYWTLASELIALFNECTLAQIPLEQGEAFFQTLLSNGYGLTQQSQNISKESEIVYQLWLAYQEEISASDWIDPLAHYSQWLATQAHESAQGLFYVIGKHRIYSAEAIFFNRISHSLSIYYPYVDANNLATLSHPHLKVISPDQGKSEYMIDIIFDKNIDTHEKTERLQAIPLSHSVLEQLEIFTTHSVENHVRAICLQAKQWLLQNKFPIGIVANDRLLIRRIRAVLEAEGIRANDLGGWAFSTTCAATSIETLLEAIENDFQKELLLDLISSPFMPQATNANYADQIYRFRQQLHQHRNLSSDNLNRLIDLAAGSENSTEELIATLQTVKEGYEACIKPLRFGEHRLQNFTQALLTIIDKLGIKSCLQQDVAGEQLIETIESAMRSTRNNETQISWPEWRQWLKNLLEHNYFIPTDTDSRITLCGFEHTDNTDFSYVILAGVEENRLLSSAKNNTFFNEKVRYELNLHTSQQINAINFIRFRQLIEKSKHCLLTAETEMHGEPQELCSWVKLIELYSKQAYSHSLLTNNINHMLDQYQAYTDKQIDRHVDKATLPRPIAPAELVPLKISASQYQTLLNCAYQYLSNYILSLRDTDLSEDFDASDFGLLVHQSLERFHFDTNANEVIEFSSDNRNDLIDRLTQTSTLTFQQALFPNTVIQGWLQRWITNIPAYINWQIQRSETWTPKLGEHKYNRPLDNSVTLEGRIDRIDIQQQDHALIDYKSGGLPSDKSVKAGEAVQLPFYALLDQKAIRAEYLELGKQGTVTSKAVLHADELNELKSKNAERLSSLIKKITDQRTLPAHGKDSDCKLCDYEGLCRKSHWCEV